MSQLKSLGINNVTIIYEQNLNVKLFDENNKAVFTECNQKKLMKKVFSEIGESILLSTKKLNDHEFKPKWDKKRIEEAALGYTNAQQAVIFERNIPTYSLTALWANGKYKTLEWRGLFQRTDKD